MNKRHKTCAISFPSRPLATTARDRRAIRGARVAVSTASGMHYVPGAVPRAFSAAFSRRCEAADAAAADAERARARASVMAGGDGDAAASTTFAKARARGAIFSEVRRELIGGGSSQDWGRISRVTKRSRVAQGLEGGGHISACRG